MLSSAFGLQRMIKLRLIVGLLIIGPASCAQAGRTGNFDNSSYLPAAEVTDALLQHHIKQVDSISHTQSLASHFASIYTASMKNIGVQLTRMDSDAQIFIKKFEISFISYFLDAAFEFEQKGRLPHDAIWNCYFSNSNAQPWQLTLIGVNAHINGDIWKGLVKNFTEQEIKRYKGNLLSFQSSISKAFEPFFGDLMDQSAYLRFINGFTKGSAKLYGEWLVYNWRLRQINLAMLYFQDQEKFRKKLSAISRKRQKIDRVILKKEKSVRNR